MCAADEAYFSIEISEKFGRVSESLRSPLMWKSVRPNPSISGMSTDA